jgi:hypothetical protein
MAILGVRGEYLAWPDAIYRGQLRPQRTWFYTSNATLFGPLHPSELPLVSALADEIAGLAGANEGIIYAPLAVGSHVDHLLVHHAAMELRKSGRNVFFYEELPYVEAEEALAQALSASPAASWRGETYLLDETALQARCQAVGCYGSQLAGIFGDAAGYAARVRAYAERVGAGAGPAERYWRLPLLAEGE